MSSRVTTVFGNLSSAEPILSMPVKVILGRPETFFPRSNVSGIDYGVALGCEHADSAQGTPVTEKGNYCFAKSLGNQIHNGQKQKGFVRCLIGGQCRPAFTVFISPQAGKTFEVLIKRHSISRLLKCLLYFILLPCRAEAYSEG